MEPEGSLLHSQVSASCPYQDHDISLYNHINSVGHALEHNKSLS